MSSIQSNDSLKIKNTNPFMQTITLSANTNGSNIKVFNQAIPEAGSANSASDTVEKQEKTKKDIDINALVKKYKKDPSKVLDELDIEFTQQQKDILKLFLQDKKDLKSFLKIAAQENLSADDIFAGVQKIAQKEGSGFFKRIGNVFKTLFKEGISEAWELAKSEQVYYSDKLGENMDDIREKREDFTSEGVADIGAAITDTPEIKENTMHFVEKNQSAGKKLYTENDVTKVVEIMQENPDTADDFQANAEELEAIKDSNNNVKYQGSTIINVTDRMTKSPDLKDTMIEIGKKSDMNDEYFDGTTENLFNNPDMQESLEKFLTAKDKNGADRFSAKNIFDQSDYMKDKDIQKINEYFENTMSLSSQEKLSGDNIVSAAKNITDNPQLKEQTFSDYGINVSDNNATDSDKYSNNSEQTQNITQQETDSIKKSYTVQTVLNANEQTENSATGEKTYTKEVILSILSRKFGTSLASSILTSLEKDPKMLQEIKRYGGNQDILAALVKDRSKVQKIKNASASINNSQLAEMINLASNETNLNNLIALTQKYGANTAIKMTRESKINNNEDAIGRILSNSTLDSSTQKEQIEELYSA